MFKIRVSQCRTFSKNYIITRSIIKTIITTVYSFKTIFFKFYTSVHKLIIFIVTTDSGNCVIHMYMYMKYLGNPPIQCLTHLSPMKSWNLIFPIVVSASKFGKVSPRFTIVASWVSSYFSVNPINVWWPGISIWVKLRKCFWREKIENTWFTTVWNVFDVGFVCTRLYVSNFYSYIYIY